MKELALVVQGLLRPLYMKRDYLFNKIHNNWHQIVGEELAEISIPISVKISKNPDDGTCLKVGVRNPGYVLNFLCREAKILENIAHCLGEMETNAKIKKELEECNGIESTKFRENRSKVKEIKTELFEPLKIREGSQTRITMTKLFTVKRIIYIHKDY